MALYHFNITHVSRGKGQSAVACAAYRSGELLHDNYYGENQDYRRKRGVLYTEIFLPEHVPKEYADREHLWNEVEKAEHHPRAQLAYSFNIALQNELTMEDNIALARQFILENLVSRGMIADLAVHEPDPAESGIKNPHIHILCPIRPIKEDGTWGEKQKREYILDTEGRPVLQKDGTAKYNAVPTTDWGSPDTLKEWRRQWAALVNRRFKELGIHERIDHRSNEERGIDLLPTIHEGPTVRSMEKRGIQTDIGDINRLIIRTNHLLKKLLSEIQELAEWIGAVRLAIKELQEEKQLKEENRKNLADAMNSYFRKQYQNTFSQKRKLNLIREHLSTSDYLTEHKIYSFEELEQHVRALYENVSELMSSVRIIDDELKDITDTLSLYSRFLESKKKRHTSEADQKIYHMTKRRLLQKYPDGCVPVRQLTVRRNELMNSRKEANEAYRKSKADAGHAYRIRKCIESEYRQITKQIKIKKEEQR